jgi:hypothetical protein
VKNGMILPKATISVRQIIKRIAAVLRKDRGKKEDRTDFVREAVEKELKRRER